MGLWNWSTTAANNATADPSINWQEGQPPSTVNDSARAMMAAIATQFQTGWEWQEWGDTPTYVSGTQFTVPGNLTSRYTVGRRVRASVTAGTVYGTITASAFTSLTTVTLTLDSGSLDSGLSEVDVGILNPAFSSFPAGMSPTFGAAYFPATGYATYRVSNFNGSFYFNNGADRLYLDAAGNLTATGNMSALGSGFITGNLTVGGNITANSDERLKTDWESLPSDFIERLAAVKSGTYTRIDNGLRQVGVGAQSLQPVLPEAVQDGEKLSVAYGQAALAACVELAKEVVRLRALLEPVK